MAGIVDVICADMGLRLCSVSGFAPRLLLASVPKLLFYVVAFNVLLKGELSFLLHYISLNISRQFITKNINSCTVELNNIEN